MEWQILNLRYRQMYAGGFRYLDRCGEFMLAAIDEFNFLPGEVKPAGAQLSLPEKGIRVSVDTIAIEVLQEQPIDEEVFLGVVTGLTALAYKLFGPLEIENNLFEIRSYLPMYSAEDAERASLRAHKDDQRATALEFEMTPHHRRTITEFSSGSTHLTVEVTPAAFEVTRINRHNALLNSTKSQISRAKRLTALAERTAKPVPYGLFLDVSMSEMTPPLSSERDLYMLLGQKVEAAKRIYSIT